jgi:hypothetical protein
MSASSTSISAAICEAFDTGRVVMASKATRSDFDDED